MFWLLGSFRRRPLARNSSWSLWWCSRVWRLACRPGAGRVLTRRRCRRLAGDYKPRVRLILFTTAAADHRHHRQHGRLNRLCWPGGAARCVSSLARCTERCRFAVRRAGRGDIDGTGDYCVAPADCPAKSARWGSNRLGLGCLSLP